MLVFAITFLTSLASTLLLVQSAKIHGAHSGDHDFSQPQKVHVVAVPRIGGIGIVAGLLAGCVAIWYRLGSDAGWTAMLLLVCAVPAFVAGVLHDFTESWTPRGRLLATALSAVMASILLDALIHRTDIPGLDWFVGFPAGALLTTVFAVAGTANAINIIDGMNGLASMCVMIMLSAIAYVGFCLDDFLVATLALVGIGAVLGFFLFNFPSGSIFLGDGGAYLLGFVVAEICILLLVGHPTQVSPLFPLLVCIYPVYETLFSIYRRVILRSKPSSMPDGIHLHSLLYRRVMRGWTDGECTRQKTRRNSMTSPYLWLLCLSSAVPAVCFYDSTPALASFLVVFAFVYMVLYWRIVRFKVPGWLTPGPSRRRAQHQLRSKQPPSQ